MNDLRRKGLQKVVEKLALILDELDSIENAEKDYRDSIPENLRDGSRYNQADAACDALGDAVGHVSDAIDSIKEAVKQQGGDA